MIWLFRKYCDITINGLLFVVVTTIKDIWLINFVRLAQSKLIEFVENLVKVFSIRFTLKMEAIVDFESFGSNAT